MGRSRLLHRRHLIPLVLLACAACGGEEDLLQAESLKAVYEGAGGAGKYGMAAGAPGRITGRVRFQGKKWEPRLLDLTTQDGFCIQAHGDSGLYSEDFLVGPEDGLANVIVYVKQGVSGGRWDPPAEPLVLDQVGCQYVPHVAVVQIGQPLLVKSSDNITHNVHGAAGANPEFNHAMAGVGELPTKLFKKPEVAKRIYCDVHGWMISWLGILPHPFHAVTAADGTFTIENVPPGTYELAFWHERRELGEKSVDVTVEPGATAEVEFTFER